MKIKLALLDRDLNYLNRIVSVFSTKYSDKFEIYSFTDEKVALSELDSARIDVLVASDAFDIDCNSLPNRCSFAYFVDSADVDTINEQKAICKFQKVDLIYKQILSVFSENAANVSGLKFGDDSAKVFVFASPSGGVGNSTMAAACAKFYAMHGQRTLYLNLEDFGSSNVFFSGEGQFDMSDIIFALKSKKANLQIKLESCVKQDVCGVYFYSQSKVALDMTELNSEDILRLISELKLTGSYDYIIIDCDFSLDKKHFDIYRQAHSFVWVSDGSEISNIKTYRAFNAISTLEMNNDAPLTSRMALVYNKFSNKTSKMMDDIGLRNIGGVPVYVHSSVNQVIEQIVQKDIFNKMYL